MPVLTRNQTQGPWLEPAVLYDNHLTTIHSQSYIAQLILNVPTSIFTHRLGQSYISTVYGKSDYNPQNKRLHKEYGNPKVNYHYQHAVSLLLLLL